MKNLLIALVCSTLFPLFARATDVGGALGGLGKTYSLQSSADLIIESPKENEGSMPEIYFQAGKRLFTSKWDRQIDPNRPSCSFAIYYDSDAWDEVVETNVYPTLILNPTTLQLSERQISVNSDGNQLSVKMVDFGINGRDSQGFPNGQILARADGKHSESKVLSLTCNGTALHLSDVKLILGDIFNIR